MNKDEALEQIKTYSEWIIKAFATENLILDYSIDSLKLVDKFMDDNTKDGKPTPHGILSKNANELLLGIGVYIGETIRKNTQDSFWKIDEDNQAAAAIVLINGTEVYPISKIEKRFLNGEEDGIYGYGLFVIKELTKDDYWENNEISSKNENILKKPWWKIW